MISVAYSSIPDPGRACEELAAGLSQAATGLLVVFCSSLYDLGAIGRNLERTFPLVPIIGCTTAGEISATGYGTHGVGAVAFSDGEVTVETARIDHLHTFDSNACRSQIQSSLHSLEQRGHRVGAENTFALMLIDGLSQREEKVTRAVQKAIGNIALIGASAGDDQRLRTTQVLFGGQFFPDAAVVALIHTARPFKAFKTQHFVRGEEKLVVTDADAAARTVREINGLPAAEEYARSVGQTVAGLDTACFAAHPVVVRIDGVDFVRSIQKANADGSLTFYCAIDEGIVLRVARSTDPVVNLRATMDDIERDLGHPQLVLVCDCILRRQEILENGQEGAMNAIFKAFNMFGFNTYGEQFCGVHVNQTLTGIAFGQERTHD